MEFIMLGGLWIFFLFPLAFQGKWETSVFIAVNTQSLWHELGLLVPFRIHFVVNLFL